MLLLIQTLLPINMFFPFADFVGIVFCFLSSLHRWVKHLSKRKNDKSKHFVENGIDCGSVVEDVVSHSSSIILLLLLLFVRAVQKNEKQ